MQEHSAFFPNFGLETSIPATLIPTSEVELREYRFADLNPGPRISGIFILSESENLQHHDVHAVEIHCFIQNHQFCWHAGGILVWHICERIAQASPRDFAEMTMQRDSAVQFPSTA